jgi:hypothetical protein
MASASAHIPQSQRSGKGLEEAAELGGLRLEDREVPREQFVHRDPDGERARGHGGGVIVIGVGPGVVDTDRTAS